MVNKYRLMSSVYEREKEEEQIEPQKIFILSVEGNATEKEYFLGISRNREQLHINSKVDVVVLRRSSKDTNSAPRQVVELLEEYIRLRELGEEKMIEEIPDGLVEKYGLEFVRDFLQDPSSIPRKQRNTFITDLMKIGYDINYRKYLAKYTKDSDEFGVLIDRDMLTHSEANMLECIKHCQERGYSCYIANPCFEFWLLLHLSDVNVEYGERLDTIKENPKISDHHTFVSKEVSYKAHHGKSNINFEKNYMLNVDAATERAKEFANNEQDLIDNIGCNLFQLIEKLKQFD